jgi:hypothetical protein
MVLPMSAITVELPGALKTQVAATARRLGVTPARFVREAVEARLRIPAPPEGRSLYDLSQDLCGSVAGGPRDLSRNKSHLHGYGAWKR